MRTESAITEDRIEVKLLAENPIDVAILAEMAKVDKNDGMVSVRATENGVVISRDRDVPEFKQHNAPSNGVPAIRRT